MGKIAEMINDIQEMYEEIPVCGSAQGFLYFRAKPAGEAAYSGVEKQKKRRAIVREQEGMKMNNVYSLKVYPVGNGREVYRKIEITGNATLDDLCETIIASFDFEDEHLYEFCMDNRIYSDYSYQSDPEDGEASTRIKLDKLKLHEKQKFLLHYDFGDDWQFSVNVEKISQAEETFTARITKQKGEIAQYPDVEDWGWEDE